MVGGQLHLWKLADHSITKRINWKLCFRCSIALDVNVFMSSGLILIKCFANNSLSFSLCLVFVFDRSNYLLFSKHTNKCMNVKKIMKKRNVDWVTEIHMEWFPWIYSILQLDIKHVQHESQSDLWPGFKISRQTK